MAKTAVFTTALVLLEFATLNNASQLLGNSLAAQKSDELYYSQAKITTCTIMDWIVKHRLN
jgi:hypothetical protein